MQSALPAKFSFFAITYRCDENWGGLYCDEPEIPLPTQLKDNFNRAPSNQNWLTVNGGKLSTVCGAVASGMALHFSGVGTCCTELFFYNSETYPKEKQMESRALELQATWK